MLIQDFLDGTRISRIILNHDPARAGQNATGRAVDAGPLATNPRKSVRSASRDLTDNSAVSTTCVFCAIGSGDVDSELVAFRDEHTVVIPSLHQRPQNLGHMLVLPTAHIPYIYDVDAVVGAALMRTLSAVARAVKHASSADGVGVRQNNEQHGGQDVFHVHFHVIPRFEDDGFNDGEDRFPYGIVEVDRDVRRTQADQVRTALGHRATT